MLRALKHIFRVPCWHPDWLTVTIALSFSSLWHGGMKSRFFFFWKDFDSFLTERKTTPKQKSNHQKP